MVIVGMNRGTGDIGLLMPFCFVDFLELAKIHDGADFKKTVVYGQKADGFLVFTGKSDAEGPWVYVNKDVVNDLIELLGEL
jgi:hypothetical protein